MLFVFGTRSKVFAGPPKRGVSCRACGHDEHATSGVLRWFHVFFVPVFPTRKQVAMQCVHCKKALVGAEVPERLRDELAAALFPARRVAPMFVGTLLAALLVLAVVAAGGAESKRQAEYLARPAAGDCYVVKLAGLGPTADAAHPFGILQAVSVADGQVRLRVANRAYSSGLAAVKALRRGPAADGMSFVDAPVTLPVADLPGLKARGTLYAVKRF